VRPDGPEPITATFFRFSADERSREIELVAKGKVADEALDIAYRQRLVDMRRGGSGPRRGACIRDAAYSGEGVSPGL
jgi:hypothetical protein